MNKIVSIVSITVVLSGCLSSTNRNTKDAVYSMTNSDLCFENLTAPIGFIPNEVRHRKLDCSDYDQDALTRLEKQGSGIFSRPVPYSLLNSSDCKDISLGKALNKKITKLGKNSIMSSTGYYQYVINKRNHTIFILFDVERNVSPYYKTKLVKVMPRSKNLITFSGSLYSDISNVSFDSCRAF